MYRIGQFLGKYRTTRLSILLCITLLILLAFLYVYLLSKSVLNVVMREEMEHEIAALNSTIGELEFTYLAKKTTVDRAEAEDRGFVEVETKQFVARHSLKDRGLTLNQ